MSRTLVPPDMEARLDAEVLRLPDHMRDGFLKYVRFGYVPGQFLVAVLSNDLREACGRADVENQRALYDYVYVLHNYCPGSCWGSPEAVQEWAEKGRQLRAEERQ